MRKTLWNQKYHLKTRLAVYAFGCIIWVLNSFQKSLYRVYVHTSFILLVVRMVYRNYKAYMSTFSILRDSLSLSYFPLISAACFDILLRSIGKADCFQVYHWIGIHYGVSCYSNWKALHCMHSSRQIRWIDPVTLYASSFEIWETYKEFV